MAGNSEEPRLKCRKKCCPFNSKEESGTTQTAVNINWGQQSNKCYGEFAKDCNKSDVWLTVHRNSVWIRKTN